MQNEERGIWQVSSIFIAFFVCLPRSQFRTFSPPIKHLEGTFFWAVDYFLSIVLKVFCNQNWKKNLAAEVPG
jgi:hypothetical protein